MAKILYLREDYDAAELRALSRSTADGVVKRRLLALAAIYDGSSRAEAADIGGVGRQILRDWVLRFNAEGEAGLSDRKAASKRKLNDVHLEGLRNEMSRNPLLTVDEATYFIYRKYNVSISAKPVSDYMKKIKAEKQGTRAQSATVHFAAGG